MHISKFSRLRRYILLNTIIYWPRRTKISGFEALLVQILIGKCGYLIQMPEFWPPTALNYLLTSMTSAASEENFGICMLLSAVHSTKYH